MQFLSTEWCGTEPCNSNARWNFNALVLSVSEGYLTQFEEVRKQADELNLPFSDVIDRLPAVGEVFKGGNLASDLLAHTLIVDVIAASDGLSRMRSLFFLTADI